MSARSSRIVGWHVRHTPNPCAPSPNIRNPPPIALSHSSGLRARAEITSHFGAAPLRAAARRLAGFVARSSHTAPGIARRSRLASGPGGLQQNVKLFLREPLGVNAVLWVYHKDAKNQVSPSPSSSTFQ